MWAVFVGAGSLTMTTAKWLLKQNHEVVIIERDFEGRAPLDLSTMIRDEARIFSFSLPDEFDGTIATLELLNNSRVVCVYHQEKFILLSEETKLTTDDEAVVIVHQDSLAELEKRWSPVIAEPKTNTSIESIDQHYD